eukprot:149161-Alexandrium_andersonii.AAC.1
MTPPGRRTGGSTSPCARCPGSFQQALYLAKPAPFPRRQQGHAQLPRRAGRNEQHSASLRPYVSEAPIIQNSLADSESVGETLDSFV